MGSLGAALVAPAGWFLAVEAAVMMWMNNSIDFYKTCFFASKIANRIITVGSLGVALVAPADWFVVVEAAVMMWMNNSMDFYKTYFF